MTPEEQLPLLLKAFEDMRRTPSGPTFIAGNQTYDVRDFRRAADKAGGEVGAVLHVLLDGRSSGYGDTTWAELERQRLLIAELRAAAKFARRRLMHALNKARERKGRALQQKLLHEALDELKENL